MIESNASAPPAPIRCSGSEILLRTLLAEGVDAVFGYPGGAVLYMYDAMHGNPEFRHVLTRHEQGAIHAADGYARSTGKTGVCLATSGPGATNLVTGIAAAYADSVPLVVITGNVATEFTGTDAFQEADIVGITQSITKHSYYVRRAEDLARVLREAFHIAGTGRKGPVLVDIPKDVSAAEAEFALPDRVDVPGYRAPSGFDAEAAARLAARLRTARRPALLAGAGVIHADASAELAAFAERTQCPVAATLLGLGAFPADHPLWLGMAGMHGTVAANTALQECDLLIAVGARFDDRVTMKLDAFAPKAAVAHIDIDPAEIGKLVPTAIAVEGDARGALAWLARHTEPRSDGGAWVRELASRKARFPLAYDRSGDGLKPQYVIELIDRTTNGEAIVTTDVGQHQMWTAQFYRFRRPRSLLTSGGLGAMGFGFPAAIGAQIGNPDRVVVSVNGDGGMQMCAQELAVCAIHRLPVKIAVINNRTLGMIRQWQKLIYDERYSHIDLSGSPDFVKLAEAYGVRGFRAETKEEAERVWRDALETPGPALVDFVVDRDEMVYPMVPQGRALHEMILGGGGGI
ncbi:biosynthetic-type acetolactate synthase large subunit [Paenibacillus sp.]|uniref:biosynthetic-type acetolactate synthase large subunit n=1 Tax=Paenibacillus sp. TaxID=58172 RepID=UPI002D4FE5B0|nr:biosynthetic-type acetolactate synthase large subunit [Paenibacillus sp.]HZG88413.1 biosynthetic-type acetolactate synthase large subunit [Paenibacillus sp.]